MAAGPAHAEAGRLVRFVIVGAANTALTLGTVYLLHQRLGVALWPASVAGYLVGMVQGFVLNRAWTFRGDKALPLPAQLAGFIAVNALCSALFGWINVALS